MPRQTIREGTIVGGVLGRIEGEHADGVVAVLARVARDVDGVGGGGRLASGCG